jgi:hypothetical protein
MKTKEVYLLCLFVVLLSSVRCDRASDISDRSRYLGQAPPGLEPYVFAPGIVSSKEYFEFSNTWAPDGKKFYFARRKDNKDIIMITRWVMDAWSIPEADPVLAKFNGFEPHISIDGTRLYFTRFAPPPGGLKQDETLSPRDMEAQLVNIWVMDKTEEGWGDPRYCVNGMYVTVSKNGTIYTTDIREASEGICRYKLVNGKYSEREHLGGGVNSPSPGAHPCIAPDESFIVFDSKRTDDPNNADLFVCFRNDDDTWGKAIGLGDAINTATSEIAAMLSPDGKYLFYQSRGDIYWVDAKIIEELKPHELK